ncbi:hypothetical protein H9M94_02030 [Mycoplasma sp. Pen4]|uniref:MAG0110 family membrane protein n=1 Tax=Mycoplasma sp. Pen4 TaxID=640330 RepID=UPI001654B32D|nr:hypothetical protein [Mycoplasma sp. Pen4]QNM93385.1 hypothetical protein H9M94_02030 [Mycoplasma sp. Pen4]
MEFNRQEKQKFATVAVSKSAKKFYGIVLLVFAIAVLAAILGAIGFGAMFDVKVDATTISREGVPVETQIPLFNKHIYLFSGIFAVSTLILMFANIYLSRRENNRKLQLFTLPFYLAYFAFSIAFIFRLAIWQFGATSSLDNTKLLLSLALIPAVVLIITAILGIFNLVNIRAIGILVSALTIGMIIALIVSIFVFEAAWWLPWLGVIAISLTTIIEWWMIRKIADQSANMDSETATTLAISCGIQMFISYSIMLIYVIQIFGGSYRD